MFISRRFASAIFFFGFVLAGSALAQDVTNEGAVGFPVHGVFSGSEFESVQMNNGNLHIEIPLWTVRGRGLPVEMKMIYDNKGWTLLVNCNKNTGL